MRTRGTDAWVCEAAARRSCPYRSRSLGRSQEDCLEFLEEERLKGLIRRYSEFINFPIYLFTTKEEEEEVPAEEGDDDSEDDEEDDEEESEVRSPAPPLTPLTCAAALVPPSSSCPTRPRSLHPRRAHRLGGIRDAHMYSI